MPYDELTNTGKIVCVYPKNVFRRNKELLELAYYVVEVADADGKVTTLKARFGQPSDVASLLVALLSSAAMPTATPSDTECAELQTMVDELEDAASISNDELGEWWEALTGLHPRILDCASPEFRAACIEEIKNEHARLKEEFRIETLTDSHSREYRELRHEDE